MREKPKQGQFFRHFKGMLYQINAIAYDSESEEEMVVYQAMYPPFKYWVRNLKEFMEKVDEEKYPQTEQQYRFERIYFDEKVAQQGGAEKERSSKGLENGNQENITREDKIAKRTDEEKPVSAVELKRALKSGQPQRYLMDRMTNEEIAQEGFMQFLDAESIREKRQIFVGLHDYITPKILSNIAIALDIVVEDGDLESRYESVLHCMDTFEQYEGGRLR